MNESKTVKDFSESTTSDFGTNIVWNTVKRSDWSASVADITWTPREGYEPNWFHRKMQEICFGIKWRKKS